MFFRVIHAHFFASFLRHANIAQVGFSTGLQTHQEKPLHKISQENACAVGAVSQGVVRGETYTHTSRDPRVCPLLAPAPPPPSDVTVSCAPQPLRLSRQTAAGRWIVCSGDVTPRSLGRQRRRVAGCLTPSQNSNGTGARAGQPELPR